MSYQPRVQDKSEYPPQHSPDGPGQSDDEEGGDSERQAIDRNGLARDFNPDSSDMFTCAERIQRIVANEASQSLNSSAGVCKYFGDNNIHSYYFMVDENKMLPGEKTQCPVKGTKLVRHQHQEPGFSFYYYQEVRSSRMHFYLHKDDRTHWDQFLSTDLERDNPDHLVVERKDWNCPAPYAFKRAKRDTTEYDVTTFHISNFSGMRLSFLHKP